MIGENTAVSILTHTTERKFYMTVIVTSKASLGNIRMLVAGAEIATFTNVMFFNPLSSNEMHKILLI